MNRPERAGVTIGAVLTAAVLPVAVMTAQAPMSGQDVARPAIARPGLSGLAIARPADHFARCQIADHHGGDAAGVCAWGRPG